MTIHYRITKRIREAYREILDVREDTEAARSMEDWEDVRRFKRREASLLKLLNRNAKAESAITP